MNLEDQQLVSSPLSVVRCPLSVARCPLSVGEHDQEIERFAATDD
jgi:hypothetical protein